MKITPEGIAVVEGDTHLSKWIVEHRTLEVAEGYCRQFAKYIPEGGTVIDVGACLGDHTATYSKMVGPGGYVFAFEPNPVAFECLIHNMKPYLNVTASPLGLGDQDGYAKVINDRNLGAAKLRDASFEYAAKRPEPVVISSMDYLEKNGWWPLGIDFIKIDAEGWERRILGGAVETLKKFKPVLLVELNRPLLKENDSSPDAVIEFMARIGYSVQPAEPHFDLKWDQVDVLFLPK